MRGCGSRALCVTSILYCAYLLIQLLVLVSGSFIPAIPQIVEDLNSTPAAVGFVPLIPSRRCILTNSFSQAVSISIFGNAIGNLWWAVYCGFCTCSSVSSLHICHRLTIPLYRRTSAYLPLFATYSLYWVNWSCLFPLHPNPPLLANPSGVWMQ
jgi:hypothetical protein